MKRETLIAVLMFVGLVAVAVTGRLLDHPPNCTPLAAVGLFAGFFFRDVRVAVGTPLVAMMISDIVLGVYEPRIMASVYAALLFPVVWRSWLRAHLTPIRLAFSAVTGSAVFFVTTNLAVWLFSGMYAATSAGLWACYMSALPFAKFTFLGDLAWSALLFGAYVVSVRVADEAAGRRARAATVPQGYL